MAYPPIEDHGIIGNMRTAALVSKHGSIDWFCAPHFDSPSVFGALLDQRRGGWFTIAPKSDDVTREQDYWPETNVLITHFSSAAGALEISDVMPMGDDKQRESALLIRRVKATRGTLDVRLECHPAFNYGRDPHRVTIQSEGAIFRSEKLSLCLSSTIGLRVEQER